MGALPKHKVSRHQRGNRRRHQLLKAPVLVVCPNCGDWMRAHRACKTCGQYKGRQVIAAQGRNVEE
jgi:large subunit ribosomal protein L32